MKIVFLGTGAAGSKLRPEAEIEAHHRRCASLLIDDNVVVDMALQSFDYATKLGAKTDCVTDVFLSHTHRDHYMKEALLGYLSVARQKINVWCHKALVSGLQLTEEEQGMVNICPLSPMDQFEAAGMHVTALPANHADGNVLHYIFEKDGKKLYYGLDGAWFTPREWRYLNAGVVLDAAILDSTNMSHDPINYGNAGEHNNYLLMPQVIRTLKETGIAREDTLLIADHMGARANDEAAVQLLRDMGLIPAYDGMTLEI